VHRLEKERLHKMKGIAKQLHELAAAMKPADVLPNKSEGSSGAARTWICKNVNDMVRCYLGERAITVGALMCPSASARYEQLRRRRRSVRMVRLQGPET
jgi:hypothetical protein